MNLKTPFTLTSLLIFSTPVIAQDINNTESIQIIESAIEPGVSRLNSVLSNDNRYQAFTVCLPKPGVNGCFEALFIEETQGDSVYEVQGIPLPWRPFSNLTWTPENFLTFERWSNPNFGYRYTIDIGQKRLISVTPISQSR